MPDAPGCVLDQDRVVGGSLTVLRSGSASDVGRVRAVNEDLALESLTLFAVADGMGGHAGGDIAAQTAIDALKSEFARQPTIEGLIGAVHEANRAVWERGHEDPALRGMGTTLTAAALVATGDGDRLVLTNVGDSRAYLFHSSELSQLTTDHSVAEELVARGELSEEEAAVHPHRHILTRALGVGPDVDVDVWQIVPEEGDRFLLCSDGLTNEVPIEQISDVLVGSRDPRDAAETLVDMANQAGGNDNATVVVLDVVVGEHPDAATADHAAGSTGEQAMAVRASAAVPGTQGPAAPADAPHSGAVIGDVTGVATAVGIGAATEAAPPPTSAGGRTNGSATAVVARSATAEGRARPESARPERARPHVPRRITFRVILFFILLGGLVVAGYAVVHWYVDGSYYVGLNHGQVVIYQGRPGGFVGLEPRVVQRSQMTSALVPSFKLPDLESGVQEPSLPAARRYVANLLAEVCSVQAPPPTLSCPPASAAAPSTPFGLPARVEPHASARRGVI
jgi:protein phosphatase